jgi:hypothetical protein
MSVVIELLLEEKETEMVLWMILVKHIAACVPK